MPDEVIILNNLVISPLLKARDALALALNAPKNDLNRDASIQRFEFSIELAWKTMKRILNYYGIMSNNPRDTIRESAQIGLIEDPKIWFGFLENRNLSSHTYNEAVAAQIYNSLPAFKIALDAFIHYILEL